MLAAPYHGDLTVDDLITYCESIAEASGGILGLGIIGRVSADERQLLATLVAENSRASTDMSLEAATFTANAHSQALVADDGSDTP